jgi:TPR repeat protein
MTKKKMNNIHRILLNKINKLSIYSIDYKELRSLHELAIKNDPISQFKLGEHYGSSRDFEYLNLKLSIELYKLSGNQNYCKPQYRLAWIYIYHCNLIIKKNINHGIYW